MKRVNCSELLLLKLNQEGELFEIWLNCIIYHLWLNCIIYHLWLNCIILISSCVWTALFIISDLWLNCIIYHLWLNCIIHHLWLNCIIHHLWLSIALFLNFVFINHLALYFQPENLVFFNFHFCYRTTLCFFVPFSMSSRSAHPTSFFEYFFLSPLISNYPVSTMHNSSSCTQLQTLKIRCIQHSKNNFLIFYRTSIAPGQVKFDDKDECDITPDKKFNPLEIPKEGLCQFKDFAFK